MPLRGNRLRMMTSPRVTLGSWKKSWLVVRCSWLVSLLLFLDKLWPNLSSGLATCEPLQTYHYTRIGCDRVSQRDASLCCPFWQPSCAFRWSAPDGPKRLLGVPYTQGRWPCIFYDLCPRSFPSPACDFVGDVPEDISEGVPLRAKGFPKRRC